MWGRPKPTPGGSAEEEEEEEGLCDHIAVYVCVCARVFVYPLLFLGNGSVETLSR
jgi:hypothetical protein